MKQKSKRSILKRSFIILLSVVGVWLLYFCFEGLILDYFNNKTYQAVYLPMKGYANVLNLSALDYDDIQGKYGVPASIVREQSASNPDVMLICNEYTGMAVHYTEVTEFNGALTNYVYLISITGKDFRFGPLGIGIGSSRIQVRTAYLLDQRIKEDELVYSSMSFPDVDEGFYGDDWSRILFCYDDAGIVMAMAYELPPF